MRIHLRSKTKFHLKTISPQGSLKQVFFRRASTATAGTPLYFKGAVRSYVGKDPFKPLWVRLSFGINNPSVSFADSSLYTREPSGVLMFPLLRVDGRRVRTAPHIRGAERSADVSPFTGSRSESENGYAYTGGADRRVRTAPFTQRSRV